MARALLELPAPVASATLRARMAALHGKEDPLLDPERFPRLLRQANDAEIADVRKLGEDSYEITPHRTQLPPPARLPAVPLALEAAVEADNGAAPPSPGAPAAAAAPARVTPGSAALRFRRGSRVTSRPAELPLVGVVQVGPGAPPGQPAPSASSAEPVPSRETKPKRRAAAAGGPRKRGGGSARKKE
jgi:hypothetical protein